MDKKVINNTVYKSTLDEIISTIELSQIKIVMAANSQLLWAYWTIGNIISHQIIKHGWGAKVIDTLSADIRKKFPKLKGFSSRNLLYMRQFAEMYPPQVISGLNEIWAKMKANTQQAVAVLELPADFESQITQQAVAEITEHAFIQSIVGHISWSHHVVLMDKCPDLPARFWYMLNTLEHGISRNILYLQIDAGLFKRQMKLKKVHNFSATLPKPQSDFANYLMKDPYIFDFVQAKDKADERNIEEQLTTHITKFLLELGQGFAFVGRQYHLHIGDSDYYIDLLFYHIKLHCYVVVELKAREFDPGDPAKLNFYINVLNDLVKAPEDNNTIGLLLCKGKNEVVAEYALKGYKNPIGVSDYVLSNAVPDDLKSTLPDIEMLENELIELNRKAKSK